MGTEQSVSSFEFWRPVTAGLETLTPILRNLAGQIIQHQLEDDVAMLLPKDMTAFLEKRMQSIPQETVMVPMGSDRFKLRSHQFLPIVQLIDESGDRARKGKFHTTSNLFLRYMNPVKISSRQQMSILHSSIAAIPTELEMIAHEYGSRNASVASAQLGGFTLLPSLRKNNTMELSGVVKDGMRFAEENKVFHSVLKAIPGIKDFTNGDRAHVFRIALAELSGGVSVEERNLLLDALSFWVAQNGRAVSIELGQVSDPQVD